MNELLARLSIWPSSPSRLSGAHPNQRATSRAMLHRVRNSLLVLSQAKLPASSVARTAPDQHAPRLPSTAQWADTQLSLIDCVPPTLPGNWCVDEDWPFGESRVRIKTATAVPTGTYWMRFRIVAAHDGRFPDWLPTPGLHATQKQLPIRSNTRQDTAARAASDYLRPFFLGDALSASATAFCFCLPSFVPPAPLVFSAVLSSSSPADAVHRC